MGVKTDCEVDDDETVLKLSGEQQTKNGLNLIGLSLSRYPI